MASENVQLARQYIEIESKAIQELSSQLDSRFDQAVELLQKTTGKVVFCGIGKSGHICKKLSSTFSSIGMPSVFLHPSESIHGDLGLLGEGDLLIFISYSGESFELTLPLQFAARKKIPVISITGNPESALAKHSQVVLTTKISQEACPFNLAPTASTTAALVLGDVLGLVAASKKGYSAEKFAQIHPAGILGLRLTMVQSVMCPLNQIATVERHETIKNLIPKMTHGKIRGVAAVVGPSQSLLGAVTDGDIRRFFEKPNVSLDQKVEELMSSKPKTIPSDALVEQALTMMEEHKIQSLFVMNHEKPEQVVGLIHIQHILKEKLI